MIVYRINLIIIFIVAVVNLFRLVILITAIQQLERLPVFKDGIYIKKVVLFSFSIDESVLLFGHFINPVILFIGFVIGVKLKDTMIWVLLFVFFLIEIGIRFYPSYEYIMFD